MDPNKRPETMERITTPELANAFIEEQVKAVQEEKTKYTPNRSGILSTYDDWTTRYCGL